MVRPLNARGVLRANLKRLMDEADPPISQLKVAKASGLPQRTISRIKRGEVAPTLDSLELLARGFELSAWQLLVPDLDPKNPPVLRAATKEEHELYDRLAQAAQALAKIKK